MLFKFLNRHKTDSAPAADEAAREAILLGHVNELDDALSLMSGSGRFSENLRYGIEALRYFRAYYGKDGELEPKEPLQKKKAILMETAWSSELLDLLDNGEGAGLDFQTSGAALYGRK